MVFQALLESGDAAAAEALFREAVALDPENTELRG